MIKQRNRFSQVLAASLGKMKLLVLLVGTLSVQMAFGDGYAWGKPVNDETEVFNVSSQYYNNTDRVSYSPAGSVGSYVPVKDDVKINGFATEDGSWGSGRERLKLPLPQNLVIPEVLSYRRDGVMCEGAVRVLPPKGFEGREELLSVSIPSTIQVYGPRLFADCTSLRTAVIGCGIISDSMFNGCTSLQHVDLSDGVVTRITEWAFAKSGLVDIAIPSSVTSIGEGAFADCVELRAVEIADGVQTIGEQAFTRCKALQTVTLPRNADVGVSAFEGCTGLTSLTIPAGVSLGAHAFRYCSSLKTVVVENAGEAVGNVALNVTAFEYCNGLESITFEGNAPAVDGNDFSCVPSSCTVYVTRGSTGWGVDIPGKWHGLNIAYIDGGGGSGSGSGGGSGSGSGGWNPTAICYVSFVYNNGNRNSSYAVRGGSAIGALPEPTRNGYVFDGWYTAATGGRRVTPATIITDDVTFYAHWQATGGDGGAVSGGSSLTGVYLADTAQTLSGALFGGNSVVGIVSLKLGKKNNSDVFRLSGTLTTLDGKKYAIKAVSVKWLNDVMTISGITVKGGVTMTLKLAANGFRGTLSNGWTMRTANVSTLPAGTLTFVLDPYPSSINGVSVKSEYLPLEQAVASSGKRLTLPRAGRVTYKKGLFAMSAGGEGNPSGLKLTYVPRSGTIKGSFYVYTFNGTKLAKYTAKVTGVAVDGKGYMSVKVNRANFTNSPKATLEP